MESNAMEIANEMSAAYEEVLPVNAPAASGEQRRYGAVLSFAMRIGFVLIICTFVLYLAGVPRPSIHRTEIPQYWGMKVDQYLEATGAERGWSWVNNMGQSDFLNFGPIALLASITVMCYLSIVPLFLQKKDAIYVFLALAEVLVLVLAASGVLPSGGH